MRRSRVEDGPPGRPVSRRDLFRRPARPESARDDAPRGAAYDLLNASRPAMGSYFEVRLPAQVPGSTSKDPRELGIRVFHAYIDPR